jgi:hypothetical protein
VKLNVQEVRLIISALASSEGMYEEMVRDPENDDHMRSHYAALQTKTVELIDHFKTEYYVLTGRRHEEMEDIELEGL